MIRLLSLFSCLVLAVAGLLLSGPAGADKVPDVRNTKHNLSASGPGTVKATSESQVCVFCHTPHAAENIPEAPTPLWNRKLSSATYAGTTYSSSSIEASLDDLSKGPTGLSKLCLSCHDGTMAIGNVNVLNGKANADIQMSNTGVGGTMPGTNSTTGFTRNLGTDLSNDHPISFTYDAALAARDGELRLPNETVDGQTVVGNRVRGQAKPLLPLEGGKVQCTTCHDPHLKETDLAKGTGKFLRLNRLQEGPPGGGAFSAKLDSFCLACHEKAGQTWAFSAHANPSVADEQIQPNAATLREFPDGLPVWRAACLSCHDTHTVQGARRLLREGTDGPLVQMFGTDPLSRAKAGGKAALEETCYQCHSSTSESILNIANNNSVPNIKDDFTKLTSRMPITTADQQATSEVHDIGTGDLPQRGKDFVESRVQLGRTNVSNRHVECTDCHNPHRVIRNKRFNDDPTAPADNPHGGAHNHAAGHTNIASGVLKGATGVEPKDYAAATFGSLPTRFDFKRGDAGKGATTNKDDTWLTREYQLCLKCHSTYAYDKPPALGWSGGGTPSTRTGFNDYTDQSMEFQAPTDHKGRASTTDSGAHSGTVRRGCTATNNTCGTNGCVCSGSTFNFQTNNHRSWHPVMEETGRSIGLRGIGTSPWLAPWTDGVGTQTMYCSDCHGSNTANLTVAPGDSQPWGPHGSSNRFILKGEWSSTTGATGRENSYSDNALCFKCHNRTVYATRNASGGGTGWSGGGKGNLHAYHTDRIQRLRCSWCHIAVPHGWKNRSFLVNLNDVGAEVGLPSGTEISIPNSSTTYTNGPYYNNAKLKIRSFGTPGSWSDTNCGSATGQGGSGKDWMGSVCSSPP